MKIALIGYGKMGRIIERKALERGHEITCRIDVDNLDELRGEKFAQSDVAIEFSRPEAAFGNVVASMKAGVPVVCGTTGWTARLEEARQICAAENCALLWASNFSIGVNIFMAVNRYLASIMKGYPQYHPEMREVHHIHKLDHPSGTAITLAEDLLGAYGRMQGWADTTAEGYEASADTLAITPEREGEVPGIHTIKWESDADEIVITHSARSRDGFALGAVIAAEWLKGKHGTFSMADVMAEGLKK